MRKRRIYIGLLLLAVAIGAIVVCFRPEREPEYGGKKLSEWAKIYSETFDFPNGSQQTQQASEAIRHIGTNAIPYLAKWIAYNPPTWQTSIKREIDQFSAGISSHLEISFKDKKMDRAVCAAFALIALDNETEARNREIGRLMIALEDPRVVCTGICPSNFPMFMDTLTNGNPSTSAKVILGFAIGLLETNAVSAVPALEGLLSDENLNVRKVATNALRRIRTDTNIHK